MSDLYSEIGRRVAERRRAAKLSQEAMSAEAGVSASFIAHIEAGSKKPTLDTLEKIARVFSIEVWQLLVDSRLTPDEKEWRARERKLAAEVQGLSVADLEFVLTLVRKLKR